MSTSSRASGICTKNEALYRSNARLSVGVWCGQHSYAAEIARIILSELGIFTALTEMEANFGGGSWSKMTTPSWSSRKRHRESRKRILGFGGKALQQRTRPPCSAEVSDGFGGRARKWSTVRHD